MAKKKLLTLPRIIAAVVLVVLVVLNIVMGVAPALGTYNGTYKSTVIGSEVSKKITAEFKGNNELNLTNPLSEDKVKYTYEYDKENKAIVEANTKAPLLTRESVFVMKTTATGTKLTSGLAITFQVLMGVGYVVCLAFILTGGKFKRK